MRNLFSYEIALLSEQESSGNSRAEATASSILGSVRGYRALVQGRIPRDKLKRRAAWHLDLTPTLQHLIPDMCYDPQEIVKSVEQLDLISEEDRPPKCLRTESEAREQLALDLVLSADVFSQRPVQKTSTTTTDDPLEVMSRATEAMSLGDSEPPVVQFGFLQPVAARCGDLDATLRDGMQVVQTEDEVGDVEDSEPLVDPLGIRLLLSEWAIGSHPQDYVYEDPYGVCEVHYRKRLLPTTLQVTAGSALQNIVSQGPPTVAPTASPVLSTRLLPSNGPRSQPSSQPQMLPPPTFGSQLAQMDWESTRGSQTLLPSTQVLPGPHGGRFSIAKKHAKKRVGGF